MTLSPASFPSTIRGLACLGALLLAGLAGCGLSTKSTAHPDRVLRPGDFAKAQAPSTPAADAPAAPPQTAAPESVRLAHEELAGIETTAGSPAPPSPAAEDQTPAPSQAWLVDAKVGDINNKAIYALSFLSPLEARLRAEARRLSSKPADQARREWTAFATKEIRDRLEAQLEDEVLRAEALASFTSQQKMGFRAFLERLQGDVIRQNYGSRTLTEEKLSRTQGLSLDEYIRQREQSELIKFKLGEQIYRKLNITWRDIEMFYEKNPEIFNPKPTAVFRLIRVGEGDAEAIASVERALARGEAFGQIARGAANEFQREEGGLVERVFADPFAQGEFFPIRELNEAARSLSEGRWAGPLTHGQARYWLFLETVRRKSRSIYDAQLEIEQFLRERQAGIGKAHYIDRLKKRASFTDLDQMTARLVQIAQDRYLPSPPAGAGTP